MSHYINGAVQRTKWALLALVFAFTQIIPTLTITNVAGAASGDISISNTQGQNSDGSWTSGNTTQYKEGETVKYRFTLTSSSNANASGNMRIEFGSNKCVFFDNYFSLISTTPNSIASVSTDGGVVGIGPQTPAGSGLYEDYYQELAVDFDQTGSVVIEYQIKLSLTAGECSGSSSQMSYGNSDSPGDFGNIGNKTIPSPSDVWILPKITLIKKIVEGSALPSDYSFTVSPSINGQSVYSIPTGTDRVVIDNIPDDGDYTAVESGPGGYSFVSGSGTQCKPDSATYGTPDGTMVASVAAGSSPVDAICEYTNTIQKGSIKIIKDADPNSDQAFGFTATNLPKPSFTLVDDGVTQNANQELFSNLDPGTTYTVTETGETNWDLKNIICSGNTNSIIDMTKPTASITLAAGEDISCTFSNVERGKLIVKKTTLPSGDQTSFPINATTNDGEIIGSPSASVTDSTDHTYVVKPGTYSVAETLPSGWQKTGDTCQNVVVGPGETKECTLTNTKLGSITISKNAVPNSSQDFNFAAIGDGVTAFTLDDDGDNTNTHQNYKTFNDLLPGSFLFTEVINQGWELTGISCTQGADVTKVNSSVTIDLKAGENVKCTYTNKRHGQIIVQKTTYPSGDSQLFDVKAGSSDGGLFFGDNTAKISDSQDATFSIQQGKTYSIAEDTPDDWTETSNNCNDLSVNGNSMLVAGIPTVYCEIVNTKKASLKITKQTNPEDSQSVFNFSVSGAISDTFQLSDGLSQTYSFDPEDSLIITEGFLPGDGWDLADIECDNDSVKITLASGLVEFNAGPGDTAECKFTNNQAPILTLLKELTDNWNSGASLNDFTLAAENSDDSSNNFSGTDGVNSAEEIGDNFEAGTYDLSEISQNFTTEQYTAMNWYCSFNQGNEQEITSGSINLSYGDVAVCEIENVMNPGLIKIVKEVINDNGGEATADFFDIKLGDNTVTMYLKSTVDKTSTYTTSTDNDEYLEVAVGDYVVSEKLTDEYSEGQWDCGSEETVQDRVAAKFSITNGQTVECKISNDDIAPSLELVKEVKNDNGGDGVAADWELKADGLTTIMGDGGVTSDDSFSAGQYTLSESSSKWTTDQYNASDWECTGVANDGDSITLTPGQSAKCTITNSDIAPTLNIKKVVTTINETEEDFLFKVESLVNNESLSQDVTVPANSQETVADAKAGSYKITEDLTNNPNWRFVYVMCSPSDQLINIERQFTVFSLDDENGEIKPEIEFELGLGQDITCIFSNEELGMVSVLKYNDLNENGKRDNYFNQGLEPVLPGVTFKLKSLQGVEFEAVTDEEGIAKFMYVPGGSYEIYEVFNEEQNWKTTQFDCDSNDEERVYIYDERAVVQVEDGKYIWLSPGGSAECTVGNASDNYYYNIAKSNNAAQPKRVGDSVIYTITLTIPEDTGVLHNPRVGDVPPTGFEYVSGSWTADSNLRGNLKPGVSVEPTYASPGVWLFNGFNKFFDIGGTIPNNAFYPGEVIVLTYQTVIQEGVSAGNYPDIALSFAFNTNEEETQGEETIVFANVQKEGDTPFVGTDVDIIVEEPEPETVLVDTGTGALATLIFGAALIFGGLATRGYSKAGRRME